MKVCVNMRARNPAVIECTCDVHREHHCVSRDGPSRAATLLMSLPKKMAIYGELNLGLTGAVDLRHLQYSAHMCSYSHLIFTYMV